MADETPSAGAIAARRSEPGVWAVPGSNSSGLTIFIAVEELMPSDSNMDLQLRSYLLNCRISFWFFLVTCS
jgi:hypothetical protein